MSWEYEIWQDDRFLDAGDDLGELERPPGSRTILDASVLESSEVADAISEAAGHRVQGLILSAATDAHGPALARIKTLDTLDLTHSRVTDKILTSVAELEGLRSLALRGTQVTGAGFEGLLSLTALRVLDLTRTALAPEALSVLARLTGLEELWLDHTGLDGTALKPLSSMEGLLRLGLSGLHIGPGQLGFLEELVRLEQLDLQAEGASCHDDDIDDDIDDEDCEEALRPREGHRSKAAEETAGFSDRDLAVLGELSSLRTLTLAGRRRVQGPGLKALSGLASLEELDLSDTGVEAKHLSHLAGLPLVRLVLRRVPLGPASKGKKGLAALSRCASLSHLDLAGATLDDEAVKGLASLAALEVLVLEDTPVQPRVLAAFAGHSALQTVRYGGYRLDRDQAVAFGRRGRPPAGLRKPISTTALRSIIDEEAEAEEPLGATGLGAALLAGFPRETASAGLGRGLVLDVEAEEAAAEALAGVDDMLGSSDVAWGDQDSGHSMETSLLGSLGDPVDGEDVELDAIDAEDDGDIDEAAEQSARLLLTKLVEAGKVELVEGATVEDFPDGLGAILAGGAAGVKKAAQVTEWLLDQEDVVEEVYYSDDELGPVLDLW